MDHVMTPFVVNSFYFCDPDGKTEYVQSREPYPVDDRTPCIKKLEFSDINAKNCHVAAAYMEGLPEQKIGEIVMRRVKIGYADNPKCDVPAMSDGVDACSKRGIFAKNIKKLTLEDVEIAGQDGPDIEIESVDEVIR
jgi:polygalacturonase